MNSTYWESAASSGAGVYLFPLVGLIVVGVLIAAFVRERRVRARQTRTPLPEEHPGLPEGGPVFETRENREPEEVPRQEHGRLTPHQLKGHSTRGSTSEEPRDANEDSGGGFGSGGLGG
ncbi:DUF6479 family protein [Streptomyces sp. NPDC051320]|uniref:DUF6479 family protein n=1 Tax=Streptomyces sp. NPDC051320 TaxID=3154644 RepID=UPI00343D4FB1